MEEKIISAIEDLALIKDTSGKYPKQIITGAYSICFMLGGYYTLFCFGRSLLPYFIPTLINLYVITTPILTLFLFGGYLIIYRSERNYTNKYYLSCLIHGVFSS